MYYPGSKLRRGRAQEDVNVSPTLTCSGDAIMRVEKCKKMSMNIESED